MPTASNFDERNVLRLLAEDSKYAFQLIYNKHCDRIYKVALLYLKSPILAEEIVQDVFFKLWFKRKTLTGIRSIEAWLYTVGKNLILNYLKKISHEWEMRQSLQLHIPASEERTDHKLREDHLKQLLYQALARLSDQQRLIYQLAREEGLSYEAIGTRLRLSPLTVKTHLARALSSIRKFFRTQGEVLPFILFLEIIF